MKKHLFAVIWALQVLWGLKQVWLFDRLRLWRKSINLYMAFLAFTDKNRPICQLRRAMSCAVVSAVYDYDTDWEFGKRDGSNFKVILEKLIESDDAKVLALELFNIEMNKDLSVDGLERGSIALQFYQKVIASRWLSHSHKDIDTFGRKLQILDDILDFRTDRIAGDTNCLLLGERVLVERVAEAKEFLESDFFCALEDNSFVYKKLKAKVTKLLRQFDGDVTFKQLFLTGRPSTGVFASILTIVGFSFFGWSSWVLATLAGVTFMLITMSIMTFNDYIDRHNDVRKVKTLASKHPAKILDYWKVLVLTILFLLAIVTIFDIHITLLCLGVWILGTLYSYFPHWFIVQSVVVAVCSGSPVLCGMIHARSWDYGSMITFGLFAFLIFVNEIYKDIIDLQTDASYKITIPSRLGNQVAVTVAYILLLFAALMIVIHPNQILVWLLAIPLVNVTFQQSLMMIHPHRISRPLMAMRVLLKWSLFILLVSNIITII